MNKTVKFAEELIDFCHQSPTPFHAVDQVEAILKRKKFSRLEEAENWKIKAGGNYYCLCCGLRQTRKNRVQNCWQPH